MFKKALPYAIGVLAIVLIVLFGVTAWKNSNAAKGNMTPPPSVATTTVEPASPAATKNPGDQTRPTAKPNTPKPPTVIPATPTSKPTQTPIPTEPTQVVSNDPPGCEKVNTKATSYETAWLRTDGSGIYDVNIEGTGLDADTLYIIEGKDSLSEDHDVFVWDTSEIADTRGFGLWSCGKKDAVTIEAIMELQRQFAYKKWVSDQSVGVKHTIVIYYVDGSDPEVYPDGAEVPLPASMGGIDYGACTVDEPSHQNTPGDVLNIEAVMTSTLGAPGCQSLFVGTRDGKNVAVFWTGVQERFSYRDGDFWVLPASFHVEDATSISAITTAMANLNITTIQDLDGNTIYNK